MHVAELSPEIRGAGLLLKGETHLHVAPTSEGSPDPTEAVLWYASHGFDFVVVTEHRKAIHRVERYSNDRVTVIPGMELNGPDEQVREYHLLGIGLRSLGAMPAGCTAQQAIDLVHADGGLAVMAHPFWLDHTPQELLRLRDLDGLEIFNHGEQEKLGKGLSAQLWHQMLMAGRRLVATAGTDAHFYHSGKAYAGRAWVVVECPDRSGDSILAALRRGRFYSSTGPSIRRFEIEGQSLRVECSGARSIYVIADRNRGCGFVAEDAKELTEAAYVLGSRRGPEKFVRVEVYDHAGGVAWTNAIFLDGFYASRREGSP